MADHKNLVENLNDFFKRTYESNIDDVLGVPLHRRSDNSLKHMVERGNKQAELELQKRRTGLYKFLKGVE